MRADFLLFAGTANPALAEAVARQLAQPLGAATIERFPDGEVSVHIEETVRDREIFLVQPTSPPVDPNLVELLAFADAARRSGAARVTAVVPYFGYARSDRRHGCREPITARLVADLIETAGIAHVVAVDLHTPQIEGFFRVPVDTLTAVPALSERVRERLPADAVVVSPDAGRVPTATRYAQRLGVPLAVLHKERETGTETRVTHLVGDVRDRTCLVVDDMISTGGTIAKSVEALRQAGGREFIVAATHGLLLDGARERMMASGVAELFVTDTVRVPRPEDDGRLTIVSVAPLIAAAIQRIGADHSLADLY